MNADTSKGQNLAPPVIVLALGIVFLAWSYTYDERAQQVPVLVGWIMVVLCVLDVIASTGSRTGETIRAFFSGAVVGDEAGTAGKPLGRTVAAILWPAAFTVLLWVFGFIPVIPVYVFLFVVVQGKKSVRQGLASAAVTTGFTYVVFKLLLRYEVYQGVVFSG